MKRWENNKKDMTVAMILDEKMSELMVDRGTGRLFKRELTREEKAYCILGKDLDAEVKWAMLQKMGFEIEEVLDMALTFEN